MQPDVRVLRGLVRRTPAGERIRIVGNSFSFVPLAEDLAAAHERGVDVQVLVDRHASGEWQAPALLREALGRDPRADSFVQLAPGGVHQKVWSFTRTGSSRDVVLVGLDEPHLPLRRPVHRRLVLGRPSRRTTGLRPPVRGARRGRCPTCRPRARCSWAAPGCGSTRATPRRPTRSACVLEAVPPVGARIQVAMYAWLDERGIGLARLLAAKDAAGADVEVVLGPSVGELVRGGPGGVRDRGARGRLRRRRRPPPQAGGRVPPGGGRRQERFVLTGSDNWTTKSLDRPEVLLRLRPDARLRPLPALDRRARGPRGARGRLTGADPGRVVSPRSAAVPEGAV